MLNSIEPWLHQAAVTSMGAAKPRCTTMRGSMKRSEEHTSEIQSLMRISYAVFCLKKKKKKPYRKNKEKAHPKMINSRAEKRYNRIKHERTHVVNYHTSKNKKVNAQIKRETYKTTKQPPTKTTIHNYTEENT